ncbi:MAG: TetR/AcrR family transcriptional regulator [Deltaproteobacteria bacterium]|nr:TetR/AcrR family transcriptional regulator [Deltaproteobacteria bacterium]
MSLILHTGAKTFNEHGYESTSLDDIAQKVQMHKTTLYHYVSNKEEILHKILMITLDQLADALKQLESGAEPPIERLRRFFMALIEVQTTDFGRCLCLIGPQPLSRKTAHEIKNEMRRLDKAVTDLIREGIAGGSIVRCDPRLASAMLFGAFNWVARWYQPNKQLLPAGVGDAFLRLFIDGLAPRPVCADRYVAAEKTAQGVY